MRIEPFVMERWQSTWEHRVSYNLSESGVHPLTIRELLGMEGGEASLDPDRLMDTRLGYAQGNGREDLRERIAANYDGAGADDVLVTHGGAEANFLTTLRLIEPGDEVVMMLPNYMQTHGLVRGWGAAVRPWHLRPDADWDPDMEELEAAVNEKTRLIILTNPNNPTGRVFTGEVLDRVAEIADRVGAWVLSDEIYRGAELDGEETPSMWGRTGRLIVTSGLSKAYGLPGLRIGWAASPDTGLVAELWSYHDYSTICPSPATEALAAFALEPQRRENILGRTRGILRENLPLLLEWVEDQGDLF
ncbi:MAG: aminotransferase class I/II-fold pyridoxal phosphate-dependent enzyme, partial [bacterium]